MRVFEIAPGGFTPMHEHGLGTRKCSAIAARAKCGLGEACAALEPGSVVFVPGGKRHQLRNTGSETPGHDLPGALQRAGNLVLPRAAGLDHEPGAPQAAWAEHRAAQAERRPQHTPVRSPVRSPVLSPVRCVCVRQMPAVWKNGGR